jgi:hypothetical protein
MWLCCTLFFFRPERKNMRMNYIVMTLFLIGFHASAQVGSTNQGTNSIPGKIGTVQTYFPPLTEGEVPEAQEVIRTLQVTHDDVRDITWYETPYNSSSTYIRLYMGRLSSGTVILRLKMRYIGPDWIFTDKFLIKADRELVTGEWYVLLSKASFIGSFFQW